MFTFDNSLFEKQQISIPKDCHIVFVSDLFVEDYVGGAELTSQALIDSSPYKVFKLHSKDVNLKNLEEGHQKFWIFGNFSQLDLNLIPTVIANLQYAILEYDFKYCKFRSPELHKTNTGKACDCHSLQQGKLISAFYYGSRSLWWMSEKQQDHYHSLFPFLDKKQNCVLSSVFDDFSFAKMKLFREKYKNSKNDKFLVLGSPSWIKGMDDAVNYCKQNNLNYEIVWNLKYEDLLEKLAQSKGHVYFPRGGDTCPRLVIETKLLGGELILNENVLHAKEEWFDTDDLLMTESYLYASRKRFWDGIKQDLEYEPTISGYTTTKDCIKQDYPFQASISSLLGFCDEVVVADGGSTDGTLEKLLEWSDEEPRLKVYSKPKDWSHKRFAIFDGQLKAEARSMCTSEFCWQQDSDEVVHENDYGKIKNIVKNFPKECQLLALPVIEFWGDKNKIRADVSPWKWRLSRNDKNITHGIPKQHRRFDKEGLLYSAGSDGCDPIDIDTYEPIPFLTFVTEDASVLQQKAIFDQQICKEYENWFKHVIDNLPSVYHFSWWDLGRKIRTYRDYWQSHWESLFDVKVEDTPENNMFFDKAWKDVSEEEINEMAKRLKNEMGGWIFHSKVNFDRTTNAMNLGVSLPDYVKGWCDR